MEILSRSTDHYKDPSKDFTKDLSESFNPSLPWLPALVSLLLVAAFRLLPHPPNFTPVGALAIVGGARIRNRSLALLLPLLALFLSDLVIGFYHVMPFVYGAFVLIGLLGFQLREKSGLRRIATVTVSASVLFFLVTNFGEWLTSPFYPKSFYGLSLAYTEGLPFFWNTLAGDLVFTSVAFSLFWVLKTLLNQQTRKAYR